VHPNASSVRIHLRRAIGRAGLPLEINLRRAIKVHVTDLIASWGHCGTNRRHTKGHVSPITKLYETYFKVSHRRFDCWLGPL
jgi:hypothetical protein